MDQYSMDHPDAYPPVLLAHYWSPCFFLQQRKCVMVRKHKAISPEHQCSCICSGGYGNKRRRSCDRIHFISLELEINHVFKDDFSLISLQSLQGIVFLLSAHWSNPVMPETSTAQKRLLAGAIPSQEFKNIHNRKQDPLCSPPLAYYAVYIHASFGACT